jgi:hypothetical protein
MKAAKLYFEILDRMKGPNAPNIYAGQNNYIHINSFVIRQETLRRLSDEQLKQIVEMVKPALQVTDDEITDVEQEE